MIRNSSVSRRRFLESTVAMGVAALGAPASEIKGRSAGPWKLGCYTRPWDRYEYRVALDGIAEAGYAYVGIMTHKGKTWVMITPETMSVKDFRDPEDVYVTPGTGRVNFAQVLTRLERGGFTRGPLIVGLDRGNAAHVTDEAGKALRFLEALVST